MVIEQHRHHALVGRVLGIHQADQRRLADLQAIPPRIKPLVQAGEYVTFRVDSKGWITGVSWNGSLRFEQSQWYAPAAGRVVRTEYRDWRGGTQLWNHSIAEMKAFRPGP